MKRIVCTMLFIGAFITASFAQDNLLIGTWGITGSLYISDTDTIRNYEKEIKENQAITTYFFSESGLFNVITNMSGSNQMETYEGIWEINDQLLIITIRTDKGNRKFEYIYSFKDDILILTNAANAKFVTTFKKQKN